MSPLSRELSLTAQTGFAELVDATRVVEMSRAVGNLNGSFARKRVRDNTYWYFAYRDLDGRTRQLYVGPDNASVQRLIEGARDSKPKDLSAQARSAHALGCAAVLPRHFRIIRRLGEYEFFRAGGVLIGTHAFVALGNSLGVTFLEGSRTLDLDFAHAGKNISVALPSSLQIDVHRAVESLEMGFLPLVELDGERSATLANPREPEFRIDFLTSAGREKSGPVFIENLNIPLQPLKHLELILEAPDQTVVLSNEGAVVVNVPAPERLAIHKLIVSTLRNGSSRIKAGKDLAQAAALLEVLVEDRPSEVKAIWKDVLARGPGWKKRAKAGLRGLEKQFGEVASRVHDIGVT